jgi:hypothetical protein
MNQKRHVSKAAHDEVFWKFINDNHVVDYPDWAVTGIFYSAMHFIDAFFGKNNKHLKSHDMADKEISQEAQLDSIYADYRALKDYRWKASYWSTKFEKSDIDNDIIPHFDKIKSSILELLSKS